MRPSKIPLILALLLLNACAVPHNDVMVFGTDTTVGVDISSSPEQANSPHFIVGYKRKELVYMPLFVNGVTSQLLKYKHQGFYRTGKGAQIKLPNGATSQTLSGSAFVVFPAGTLIKLDPQTELTFAQGSTFSLANNSGSITVSADNYVDIPENSLVQDVSGVTYQGIDLHNAKYLARSNSSDGNNIDTYSVLASFGANIEGGTTGNGVGIAQYFATGIAAQNLTRKAGAELVTVQSADTKLNNVLEKQVDELKKENVEILKDKIGTEKELELIEKNKQKISVEGAKLVLIGNAFTKKDGTIDKDYLLKVLPNIDADKGKKVTKTVRDNITAQATVDSLLVYLRDSSRFAISPLFDAIAITTK